MTSPEVRGGPISVLSVADGDERVNRAAACIARALAMQGVAPQSQERELHNALSILRGER